MPKETDKPYLKLLTNEIPENLTAREAKVLRTKFGVNLENAPNLEDIAKQFDVTRERIREIEEKALKKLREQDGGDDPSAA